MAYSDAPLAGGYFLRLGIDVASQNIALNTTTYYYSLTIYKGSGSGKYAYGTAYWSVGASDYPNFASGSIGGYDFRNTAAITLAANYVTTAGSPTRNWAGAFTDIPGVGELGSTQANITNLTPPSIPLTPSSLAVTRVSDGQHTLNWVGASNSTVVHRATDGGAWQEVGRPGGSPTSWTDTTTVANRRYEYRVANVGGAGQSAWSGTVEVFTTPAPVATVSAARVGMDIQVTASGLPPYATAYDIYDGLSLVGSGVLSFPWTHSAPAPGNPHTYTVRSRRGTLVSALSPASNTVQLQAPPNPPTGLNPNGGIAAADGSVRLSWTHNPVDTSAQSSYELRHRPAGGAWETVSGGGDAFRDVTFAAGVFEWQVRTKGADPGWSGWSAVASVTVITRPGVAVMQPTPVWGEPVVPVEWSWLQAQGRPQSSWQVELLDGSGVRVDSRSGSGADVSVTFAHRVGDGFVGSVRVRAATGDVWSAWAVQTFSARFVPPAPAGVVGVWDEGLGGVSVGVTTQSVVMPDVTNYAPQIVGSGVWAEVARFVTGSTPPVFSQPEDFRVRDLGAGESVMEIQTVTGDVVTELGRNKFLNPSFVSDGTQVQVHENVFTNPNPTNAAIWIANGLAASFQGTGAGAYLYVSATATPDPHVYVDDSNVTVAPGQPLTFAAQVWHGPTATGTNMVLYWLNAAGAFLGYEAVSVPHTPSAGPWSYVGGIAPAGAVRAVLVLGLSGGSGAEMLVAKCMAVRTLEHVPYFDGYSTTDSDMTTAWVGAANGSISRSFAPKTRLVTGGYTTHQAGQASALRIPQGRTATLTATAGEVVILTAATDGQTINGVAGTVGDNRVVGTSTVTLGAGDWLTAGRYVSGYTGPQFSGGHDATPFIASWVGAANNSESVLHSRTLASTNCVAGLSVRDGIPAIRVIPTTASNDSTIKFTVPAGDVRTQSTMLATLHLDEPLTGSLHANSRKVGTQTPVTVSAAAPNEPGETELRIVSGTLTSDYVAVIRHGGAQGSGHMWVTHTGLFEGDYAGPAFDATTPWVEIENVWYYVTTIGWNAVAQIAPPTVSIDVERSLDGGETWEPWIMGATATMSHHFTDWEARSRGTTLYRATTRTTAGATTATLLEVVSDSTSIWLSGGQGFAVNGRLPFDPQVAISPSRARTQKRYAGRALAVAYAGEALARTVQVSGRTVDHALSGEESAGVEALTRIAQIPDPVHMFRDPDGRRIYGQIGDIAMSRDMVTPHGSGWNALWGYDFTLSETGRD